MGTSAWSAPGAGAAEMVEAIVRDTHRVLPCAAGVEARYGLESLVVGVPVRWGAGGVLGVVELDLDEAEMALLNASAEAVRAGVADLRRIEAAG